jgi:hypothetical protein
MFLQHKVTDELIEILDCEGLYNPCQKEIVGMSHAGEEMQDPAPFLKSEMMFPSGEPLPRCWLDPHYRITPASVAKVA